MGRNEGAGLQGSFPASDAKECGDGPNPASVLSGAEPRVLGAVQARVDVILVELTVQDESNALSLPFAGNGLGVASWSSVCVTSCQRWLSKTSPSWPTLNEELFSSRLCSSLREGS